MFIKNKALLRYPFFWSVGFILFWSVFYFFLGEKITVNQGLGYDGVFYGRITQNFDVFIENKSFSFYYVNRILPCGIVYIVLKTFGLSVSVLNIINGFYVLNTLSWILSMFFLHKIWKHYQISENIQWLMTVLLLINFYVLKFIFYTPVLTDSMAFLSGVLLLWFYIKNNLYAIILTGFFGSFVYPLFCVYACILVVLPTDFKLKNEKEYSKTRIDYWIIGFLVFGFVVARMYIAYRIKHTQNIGFHLNTLLYVSAYSYVLYHILPLYTLIKANIKHFFEYCKQKRTIKRISWAVVLFLSSTGIKAYLTQNPVLPNPSTLLLIKSLAGIDFHGLAWLAECFSAFGLIAVLLIIVLKKVRSICFEHSVGFYCIILCFYILLLRVEMRDSLDIYAFVLLAIALYLNAENVFISKKPFIFLIFTSILLSKFFLSIENGLFIWSEIVQIWIPANYGLSTYLMNDNQYVVLLIVFLAVTGILYITLKRSNSK